MRGEKRQQTAGLGDVSGCCDRARALEQAGRYEEARELLSDWWPEVGERPILEGLNEREAVEVKLRVGCLTSWLGSARPVEGAQDLALDLLSECARTFEDLGLTERQAEAEIGMSHAYLRKASYDEARVILNCVLGNLSPGGELALSAIAMLTTVERAAGALDEALRLHESSAPLFEGDDVPLRLKGVFHYNWAVTLRKLGHIDVALSQYDAAKECLEKARDTSRLAIVETSLGVMFYELGAFPEAVEHTRQAISLFEAESNQRGVAEANETLSRVLVEVGDYGGAESAARAAVNTLRAGDEKALLVEALTCLGTALARQGRRREAHVAFGEAEEEASNYVGRSAAAVVVMKVLEELCAPACLDTGLNLEDPVNLLEKEIIRCALRDSNKQIKEAAIRLGVEYDTLRYIVNNRHSELREERTRVYARPHRGIVKQASSKVKRIRDRRGKS
jgi:tetratricopeptide (TPR) repeat protein